MKVFHIASRCDRVTAALLSDARRRGITAAFAAPPDGLPNAADVPAGVELFPVGTAGFDLGGSVGRLVKKAVNLDGSLARAATAKLVEQLRAFEPDVVHLHGIHGGFIHFETLFEYLASFGGKVVWTLEDCRPLTGGCRYIGSPECPRWSEGCGECPRGAALDRSEKIAAQGRRLFASVKNMTLVSPSRWLAELAGRSFLAEFPCAVVPKGADPRVFRPLEDDFRRRYGIEERRMVLAVADGWTEERGLGAVTRLSAKLDSFYQTVIVGLTPKQISALPPEIIGLRRIGSATELAAVYSTADLLVSPAAEANFPIVNVEAMACGTPVVAYDAGGAAEALAEGCGVAVPCGDEDALLEAVNTVSFDRERCVARAREFTLAACCDAYARLYDGTYEFPKPAEPEKPETPAEKPEKKKSGKKGKKK